MENKNKKEEYRIERINANKEIIENMGYTINEEIKNLYTPILVSCICGNKWKVKPKNIINSGVRCGCRGTWRSDDVYKDRKTVIYFISVDNYYKIGVSIPRGKGVVNKETIIKQRYGGRKYKEFDIKVLDYKVYENGLDAKQKEKQILKEYKKYKVITKQLKENFGGYSELFYYNISKLSSFML